MTTAPGNGRLLAVNVGRPHEVDGPHGTTSTAIWKAPVPDRRRVRRLGVAGDAQADLVAHGGEHRAVPVYQVASYRYWEGELGRELPGSGAFGENFTVDGLPDDDVRIGDRYRIGSALLEVSQPRVTCFKVGLLELTEVCDVPADWSCRTGVCHRCRSPLVSGTVSYDPAPLDPPADATVLLCCARPASDLVLDL